MTVRGKRPLIFLSFVLLAGAPTLALRAAPAEAPSAPRPGAEAVEFFESKVRPVLVDNCYTCHSAETNAKGGLRVDDRNGMVQGGNSGPAVVPGKPEESLLIQAVRHADDAPRMPPKKTLTGAQIADLTRWVREGAAWPAVNVPAAIGKPNAKYDALRAEHWAWQPLRAVAVPAVGAAAWVRDDLDRFLLARLEARGLSPVADADRRSLLRRVTFDLTGLPPTPDQIVAFLADDSAVAFERVVDRLLASPAFGERWGRHWLDVARYGESTGGSRNVPFPHAWRYRDYVIDAFNRDQPYDQFLREQIAGDLLPARTERERQEHLIATGFLALGVKDVNQRFKVRFVMDNVDEQIDTVSRAVLATTASCARCHDHKFDPIPTADYYALAGIFRSTELRAGVRNKMGGGGLDYYDTTMLITLDAAPAAAPDPAAAERLEKARGALARARSEFEMLRDSPEGNVLGPNGRPKRAIARQTLNKLQRELAALSDPAANGARIALGVHDATTIADTEIRIRGEAENLGMVVPRGFLSVLQVPGAARVNPSQSGRLELAQWLASANNPLTPRVMVNRVWQHLFGQGLVRSVDNFGATGDLPSHPELLDHLAARFVRGGWSVKALVRTLVLSHAYRLGTEAPPGHVAVDPSNRLVWRHAPRRLDAEEIRDATLAAAGTLDQARPAGSPARDLKVMELPNNGPLARQLAEKARASTHRSLYLPLLRGLVPTSLEVFDFAEQAMVTGSRDTTTVATQALSLLNDPFVRRQSLNLAVRLARAADLDDRARLDLAYRLTLGRPATVGEIDRATRYLSDYEAAARVEDVSPSPVLEPEPAALAASDAVSGPAKGNAKKTPAPPVNPDEVIPADDPVKEEVVEASSPREAAWASFCQALLGTVEFRYVQ